MRCDEILANSIIFDTTQQLRTAWRYGLGERLNGIQEVSGSIPLISTKRGTRCQKTVGTIRSNGFSIIRLRESGVKL